MIYTKYTGTGRPVVILSQEPASAQNLTTSLDSVSEQNQITSREPASAKMSDAPYTIIGAKAFLSHKEIEKLVLPSTITSIEDWAFAHMHQLKELVLPANAIHFGKKVFLDCSSLESIRIEPDTSRNPGLPYFLADLVTVFSNMDLLDPLRAASENTHSEWMNAYDALLTSYLQKDDETGFEPVFYGWFNDEDPDIAQRPGYIRTQRAHKVRMAFRRLTYDNHLAEDCREILESYLRDHMPWGDRAKEHTAVWDLLPEQYSDDIHIYHILETAGALPPDRIPQLIEHLPHADPEIIAWLLRYQEKHRTVSDFFDNFSL